MFEVRNQTVGWRVAEGLLALRDGRVPKTDLPIGRLAIWWFRINGIESFMEMQQIVSDWEQWGPPHEEFLNSDMRYF